MSKERQRRRAAREAAAAKTSPRGATPRAPRRAPAPKPARRNRRTSPLAAERRTQNLVLAAGLLMANVLLWTQIQGWPGRIVALVLTVALWPVIVTVVFDRKSS